jgi:hypothetical protein
MTFYMTEVTWLRGNAMLEVELKLKSKNRKVWLVGILWMLVSGILFYFITGFVVEYKFPTLSLTYLTLFLLTFVVFTLTGVSLKAPMLSWRNAVVFPFGIVIAVIFNEVAPRWTYPKDALSFAMGHFFFSLILYVFTGLLAVMFVRLCVGYEVAPQFQGKIHSYVFSCQIDDTPLLLEKLLIHFNIEKLRIYSRAEEWSLLGFRKWPNRFLVYCQRYNGKLTEVNFVAYRLSNDMVVEVENGNVETFFAALDGIVRRWKEQGLMEEAIPKSKPEFIKEARKHLLDKYINPIKFQVRIPPRKYLIEILKSLPKKHPYIFAFISTIVGTVLATLILKFLGY